MKIATVIVRWLMGLLFLFASITYFFKLITPPPLTGAMKTFNDGLEASVYLMPAVKLVELVCARSSSPENSFRSRRSSSRRSS